MSGIESESQNMAAGGRLRGTLVLSLPSFWGKLRPQNSFIQQGLAGSLNCAETKALRLEAPGSPLPRPGSKPQTAVLEADPRLGSGYHGSWQRQTANLTVLSFFLVNFVRKTFFTSNNVMKKARRRDSL